MSLDSVLYKELTVSSGFASTATSWSDAMRLINQDLVQFKPLLTKLVPLEQFSTAFDSARRSDGIKTALVPTHS